MREDFSSEQVHSYDYLYLGDTVNLNGGTSQVSAVRADLTDGILQCTYSLSLKTGFRVPEVKNQQASGRMMTGEDAVPTITSFLAIILTSFPP